MYSIDPHLQDDFIEEYQSAKNQIRNTLLDLENTPGDIELTRDLFRSVHSVKSNLHMIGLAEFANLIHQLENLLDAVRNGQRKFSHLLSDLILLNLEAIEDLFTKVFAQEDVEIELLDYTRAFNNLSPSGSDDRIILQVIRIFDPEYSCEIEVDDRNIADDKLLFENLANSMEQRLIGKEGSTRRIVEIALAMNEIAGNPLDSSQLFAAAMMHDVAMAFLPLKLLNKKDKYSDSERHKLHHHPLAAAELLASLEQWQAASKMVAQHHERVDGKGYPNQLQGEQICAGAKILAIADTFESMSRQRADREQRRSIIRIVAEVNACKDEQFDDYWVGIFNQYIRQGFLKPATKTRNLA